MKRNRLPLEVPIRKSFHRQARKKKQEGYGSLLPQALTQLFVLPWSVLYNNKEWDTTAQRSCQLGVSEHDSVSLTCITRTRWIEFLHVRFSFLFSSVSSLNWNFEAFSSSVIPSVSKRKNREDDSELRLVHWHVWLPKKPKYVELDSNQHPQNLKFCFLPLKYHTMNLELYASRKRERWHSFCAEPR